MDTHMSNNNPLIRSVLIVSGFWWFVFTLRHFDWSLFAVFRHWQEILHTLLHGLLYWLLGILFAFAAAAGQIWLERFRARRMLRATQTRGLLCSMGQVPMLAKEPARIRSVADRLPIADAAVSAWLESAKKDHPRHATLFLAIWDIYSAHADWPASHRVGGHGGRTLTEHCVAVVQTSLATASGFKYEGVKLKTKGKRTNTIIPLLDPEYAFDAADPLIPVLALAHDIGKLEAYKRKADGTVGITDDGTGRAFDDLGVDHDALGARILARVPEFWGLPPADRRIASFVIGYYHHPASFPVERDGSSLGDRMCALLQFLIESDKATGRAESGLAESDEVDASCEDEAAEIYAAFLELVTEHGRVGGADAHFAVGAKYGQLVVLKESRVRALMLAKLNRSNESGSGVSTQLLAVLLEKGLLHAEVLGVDLKAYLPLWNVDFYDPENGKHIMSWDGCIVIKPVAAARELDVLMSLRSKRARLKLTRPTFAHNEGIGDPDALRSLLRQAFDPAIVKGVSIPKPSHTLADPCTAECAASCGDAGEDAPPNQGGAVHPIRDEDAPRARDVMTGSKARESLELLHAARSVDMPLQPPRKKRRRKEPLTVDAVQGLVERYPSAVSGERDGYRWVVQHHLNRIAGAEAFLEAQTTLALPILDAGNGLRYLGIPFKEPQSA